jgi:hypothetical protein
MGSSPTLDHHWVRWGLDDDEQAWDRAAFDRLNPDFGVVTDHTDPVGQRAVQEREAGLSLGTRVAVAASRENDPHPVLTILGQDYRAADAARGARLQAARARPDRARVGAER